MECVVARVALSWTTPSWCGAGIAMRDLSSVLWLDASVLIST